ncbi:MAG: hypothetical protein EAX96_20995 [Candidatus Lokiarchaeota archaeon]|nr:hypothetical protein [Candidatus Lokiarchaeota archaeon]
MQESKTIPDLKVINALENNQVLGYKELNALIRQAIKEEYTNLRITNVYGQRFIGAGLICEESNSLQIEIIGTPGNDFGIFLDGPKLIVKGNAEDQVGNTMNDGTIIIHGDCRDVTGLSMRGGKIFVKGNAGYRIGIHMKEYQSKIPTIVIGGSAKEFFGEYMAGGMLIALGLQIEEGKVQDLEKIVAPYVGSGIHGGTIFLRGDIPDNYLGIGAVKKPISESDQVKLEPIITEFCKNFNLNTDIIWNKPFNKIFPGSHRPYAAYYTAKPI